MPDNPIKHSDIIQPGNPLDDLIKGLEKTLKLLKQVAKEHLKFAKAQDTTSKKGKKNIQAVAQATQQLTIKEKEALKIKKQLEIAQAKLALAGSKENKQLIKTKEAVNAKNAALRRAAKEMRTGTKTTNTWGKALGSFAFKFNALGNIVANVASRITRTFSRAIRGAMRTIMDFEQAMADVRSVTNATDKDFKALSKSAMALGGSTKFTAIEVAKLQKELAKLGFTTEEILAAQSGILSLAAATNTDLARAAEVAGITIRQFGLDASQMQRVVDVMAKSFSTSALDMEKFAESMKMVGPIASKAGFTLEETTARLAQLANAGISASMGGTALRQIFLVMAKGGKDLGDRIKELSTQELGLAEASEEVQKRAAAALLVLADGVDTVDDYTEALNNAAGASQTMADIQLDTLEGKITILKSAWDRYILTLASSETQFLILKAVIDGTSIGLNDMADGVDEAREESSKFDKALKELWRNVKRTIPVFGTQAVMMEQTEIMLLKNKEAADKLKESFEEIVDSGVVEEVAEVIAGVAKRETLRTLNEQIKDLKEKRSDASRSEIGAINREIKALEAKIKKYKDIGLELEKERKAVIAFLKELDDFTEEDLEAVMPDLGFQATDEDKKAAQKWLDEASMRNDNARAEEFRKAEEARKKEEDALAAAENLKQAKIKATFDLANRLTTTFTNIFAAQKAKELSAAGDNAEKRLEIEKEFAKKEQILAIGQAIVDGASAIMKTQAQLGWPAALPFMIASAAMTAVQIGVIASQKFGEGEVDIYGPSHSMGGIPAEIEGGESVINKQSTSKYKGLLQAINANDTAAITDAAMQNEAFHNVWGRTRINDAAIMNSFDPNIKKMREIMENTPVMVPKGPRTEYYPGQNKTRIIKNG